MEAILIILLFYFAFYMFYMVRLAMGIERVAGFGTTPVLRPVTTFTIIVPFRNEEEHLPRLLDSLAKMHYPRELFEVIFIDDGSVDAGQSLVYRWRMKNGSLHATLLENIRRSGSPKKDAISRAIPIATGDWIVTTDADCIVPEEWLKVLDQYVSRSGKRMIAGPVCYGESHGLAGIFQRHDLLAMQGATMGGFGLRKPFMCNGANFAYEKKLFHELGGFSGNESKPGGDDVFLLHKATAAGVNVAYLKCRQSIVVTKPESNWKSLVNQRVRWASKSTSYQSSFAEEVALAVLFGNAAVLALGVLAALQQVHWLFFALPFGMKFLVDWRIMAAANSLLKQQRWLFPILSSVIYPIFTLIVALLAMRGKYTWKGRKWASRGLRAGN